MTKQQLIDSLKSKFSFVGEEKQTGEEMFGDKKIIHISIPVIDVVNNSLERRWVDFYVEGDNAYWQNVEPKVEQPINFQTRLQSFIDSKITDGTIRFGIIKESNEANKVAKCEAIMPDKTTKIVLVKEVNNKFSIETL
jgi:hypothetical protein